ncbi:MAG: DNA-processing protein DprA [Acetatifactor sp.]|nr:DNA-processing protein DprA [Acetatifactor sp.]
MYQEKYKESELPYELWLCSFPDVGNRQLLQLAELCGGAKGVYYAGLDRWRQVLKEKQVESLKRFTESWKPEREYERLKERGIRLVTLADRGYPGRLREIPDAPYGLFVCGSLPGEQEPTVAVVGARECSQYGSFVADKLGEILGRSGITVVSGMARGVDGISQQAALNVGGRSCGVLGCGIDICYPKENRRLYDRLPGQGCLISSYPLGTPALAWNFPPRNRIVSGLSDAVVVVEAREKSGTLITVDMALEQGKEVYAVPGRITDRLSDGCNRLIRQGAVPLLNPEELIQELYGLRERQCAQGGQGKNLLSGTSAAKRKKDMTDINGDSNGSNGGRTKEHHGIETVEERKIRSGLPPELEAVYSALELTPRTVEEIRVKLPQNLREGCFNLNACLMRLCVENMAVQVSPGCFSGVFARDSTGIFPGKFD